MNPDSAKSPRNSNSSSRTTIPSRKHRPSATLVRGTVFHRSNRDTPLPAALGHFHVVQALLRLKLLQGGLSIGLPASWRNGGGLVVPIPEEAAEEHDVLGDEVHDRGDQALGHQAIHAHRQGLRISYRREAANCAGLREE